MPTMSSSLVQPLVTPSTAFETSARVRPCRAASSSFSRTASSVPSFFSSVIPVGSMAVSLPFGPSTSTVLPCTVYFTVAGSGIGFLPIRDISISWDALPDFAEDLAADAFAPRLPAGHYAPWRGHDADAEATLHPLDFIAADIDAAARARNARQVANGGFVVGAVLEVDPQHCAGNLGLQLRRRNIQLLVARTDGIADARHKVGYWIGQTHSLSSTPRSLRPVFSRRTCGNVVVTRLLPTRFNDPGDFASKRQLAEAQAA